MAGPGLGLLRHLLEEKKAITVLSDIGIVEEDFINDELPAFQFIRRHYETYGELPSVTTVEQEADVKIGGYPTETLKYWADRLTRRNKRNLILDGTEEIRTLARDGDLVKAHSNLHDLMFTLNMGSQTDRIRNLAEVASEVVDVHNSRQTLGKDVGGVPFGIPYLDRVSDGAQPSDTIALVGRPGVGKTYLLLRIALNAWDAGYEPMILSMEMGPLQIARRLMALRTGVSVKNLRMGRVSHYALKAVTNDIASLLCRGAGRSFYLMQGSLTSTVEDLVLRIQEHRPSALYVDGAYMLRTRVRSDARWERVAATAEILKLVAAEFGIPCLSTYQFNRRGPGSLGNIGGSDAIGQLASIVVSIEEDDSEGNDPSASYIARQFKLLRLIKGREGERGTIRMLYDLDQMKIEQEEVVQGYEADSYDDTEGEKEEAGNQEPMQTFANPDEGNE